MSSLKLSIRNTLVVASAALMCAACTGGDKTDSNKPGSGAPSATGSATSGASTPAVTSPKLPKPSDIKNDPAQMKNVAVTSCKAIGGGWSASGTAKNTQKEPVTFKVTIFFTTPQATVQGYGQAKLDVAAGKAGEWSTSAKFAADKDSRCIVRAVSAS